MKQQQSTHVGFSWNLGIFPSRKGVAINLPTRKEVRVG